MIVAVAPTGAITHQIDAASLDFAAPILRAQEGVTPEHEIVVAPPGVSGLTHRWTGDAWEELPPAPPAPEPVPATIRLTQCMALMRDDGLISAAERLAWAQRQALPAIVEQIVGALPEAERDDARALCYTMTEVTRAHPYVVAAIDAFAPGATAANRQAAGDAWFRRAASL